MIFYIVFSSLYLFITSIYHLESLYYLFIHLLLYSFYINKKNFFRLFFFTYGVFILATPILVEEISRDLGLKLAYSNFHYLPETLLYISLYLSILVIFVVIFSSYFSKKNSVIENLNISINKYYFNPILITIIAFFMVVVSYMWLFSIGYLSYIEDRPSSPFITLALALSSLSITLILCLGYMLKNTMKYKNILYLLYVIIILATIFFGFQTGSRMALIFPFMAIIYNHQNYFKKRAWIFILASPLALFTFVAVGLTRNLAYGVDLQLLYSYIMQDSSFLDIGVHVAIDRFNFLRAINEVFKTYSGNFIIYTDYLQNIYGMVPRLIWPDKPVMGVDLNYIGIEMGVSMPTDTKTSYGLHYIGESFYQLRWFGLIIPFLQSVILAKIDSIKENISVVTHVISFQLTIYVVMVGSLLTFIPELTMLLIPIVLLSAALNNQSNE